MRCVYDDFRSIRDIQIYRNRSFNLNRFLFIRTYFNSVPSRQRSRQSVLACPYIKWSGAQVIQEIRLHGRENDLWILRQQYGSYSSRRVLLVKETEQKIIKHINKQILDCNQSIFACVLALQFLVIFVTNEADTPALENRLQDEASSRI